MIAANSVVTKSCKEDNVLLVGVPATIKKRQDAWYINNEKYANNIKQIEQLINKHV